MPFKNAVAELQPEIAAWRQALHSDPELLFETHRTAAFVAQKLREFGVDEVVTGLGRTGVVGVIRGVRQTSGRVIGLRADMDALPIQEETGLDYASKTAGAMHACGHDGHTAMLLGAAKYLAETRNFDGTAVVIFQPAEEGGGGGREMCEDGLMERFGIQQVYGMHNWPQMPTGEFAIRSGAFFAATDMFELTIKGRGGHAAKPNITVDPTLVASHVVLALQSIVSRNADPVGQLVVSVTSFETSSTAFNVIPQIDVFLENGYTKEEMKMVWETNKIFGDDSIRVNPTAVRVPVFFGHAEALHIETNSPISAEEVKELLKEADGVVLCENDEDFPTQIGEASGQDATYVGRVRQDISHENGVNLWIVADNVRKGAATNSVQIGELLIKEHLS